MYFESEQHYNECMSAQAEAEGQALHEQQCAYNEYLQDLIDGGEFELYAIEVCLDMLNSRTFEKSGLTAQAFLTSKKQAIEALKESPITENSEMPF